MKNLIYTFLILLMPQATWARDLQLVKTFQDWQIATSSSGNCYAISEPKRTRAFYGLRNKPFFAIKYNNNSSFSMSVMPGFKVNKTKGAMLDIGARSYAIRAGDGNFIWPDSSTVDASLLNALLTSKNYFRVHTTNLQNHNAIDYYSIRGLYRALQYIEEHCATSPLS